MNSLQLILSRLRYLAPSWVFTSVNIMTGTWVLYLPHVKEKFALNDAEVGMALFCMALGILISIPVIPWINNRYGVGRATKYGLLMFALLYNLPLLASSFIMLCISLLTLGLFTGLTDVSMNALVSTIEKEDQQNFMSAAHGFFSLGGFIGAGIGSLFMVSIGNPSIHMGLVSALIILSNLLLARHYDETAEVQSTSSSEDKMSYDTLKPLIGISMIAFIIMCNEGATEHWSNLFFHDEVGVSESKAGLGFVLFSLCMTIGRFLGDGISARIGSMKIIIYGAIIALVAYMLILTASFYVSIVGFGLLGLGFSVIIPELFRLAGNTEGVSASISISVVSGIGFVGFLAGPVVLGMISNSLGLTMSFRFLLASVGVALLISFFQKKPKTA